MEMPPEMPRIEGALWEKEGQHGLYLIGHIIIDGKKEIIICNQHPHATSKNGIPNFIIRESDKNKNESN